MQRADYISASPHVPGYVTAKSPRDSGRQRDAVKSGVNWRKLSRRGEGREGGFEIEGERERARESKGMSK